MKITLNLASEPYVDVRSIIQRLRILMGVLILLALPLWLLLRAEQGKAKAATERVDAVENNVQRLEQQQQSYQALMRQPQNAAVLTQSDFLNSLFRRKAFSWTATMTDLETVLPGGVQVLSIEPEVAPDGAVTIRLRVSGARDRAVELVKNLEKSRHFASPRLSGEALATMTGPNQAAQPINASIAVNFDILADYRPLSAEEEKEEAAAEKSAEEKPEKKAGERMTTAKRPQPKAAAPGMPGNIPGNGRFAPQNVPHGFPGAGPGNSQAPGNPPATNPNRREPK
jgi:type IV pilus assembly protein PilN